MGSVYKKTFTKPLPEGAEILTRKGERLARWKDAKGKTRTAPITVPKKGKNAGQDRIVNVAGTYTAKYRHAQHNAVSAEKVNRKDPLTTVVNESSGWAMTDSNHRPPRCKRGGRTVKCYK